MSQLIYSYALSLGTKTKIGTTPSSTTAEDLEFLDQHDSNILLDAKSIKLSSTLGVGTPGQKTYDLRDFGINYVRSLMVKVVGTVDPSAVVANLRVTTTVNSQTISGKTLFLDLAEPASVPVPSSATPISLTLLNPNSVPISLTVIVIGY